MFGATSEDASSPFTCNHHLTSLALYYIASTGEDNQKTRMSETNNYIAYLMCFLLHYDKAKKAALVRKNPIFEVLIIKGKIESSQLYLPLKNKKHFCYCLELSI